MNAQKPLLLVLLFGILGVVAELALLEHWDDPWQWTPFVVLGLGAASVLAHLLAAGPTSLKVLRGVMVVFIVTGALGLWRHYRGNVEFEVEMYPSLAGPELVWKALTGATPALAPGFMIFLGLVGLVAVQDRPSSTAPDPRLEGDAT